MSTPMRVVNLLVQPGQTVTVAACPHCSNVCIARPAWRARKMRREHMRADHQTGMWWLLIPGALVYVLWVGLREQVRGNHEPPEEEEED